MTVNPSTRRLLRLTTATAVAALVATTGLSAGAGSAVAGVRQAPLGGRLPLVAPTVTPAGPVAGSGCTTSGTTAACHLYAVAGSVALPGIVAPVPTWKFQADAGGARRGPADRHRSGPGRQLRCDR